MNVLAPFRKHAGLRPGQAALVQGLGRSRRTLSFAGLDALSGRLAEGLRRRGLRRGDRMLVFIPMSIELYAVLLACFRSGLSAVFLDAWSDRARLDAALEAAAPQAAFLSPRAALLLALSPALRRVPRRMLVGPGWTGLGRLCPPGPDPESAALPNLPAGQEAYVTFTTGSTGKPKGAPRSHAFLRAQARALSRSLAWRPGGVDLAVLPSFVLFNLNRGVTSVLPDMDPRAPLKADPGRQIALIDAEGVSSASGSPAFFGRLADEALRRGRRLPLERLSVGGAAVDPGLAGQLQSACVGKVEVVYGSTEAEPIAHCSAGDLLRAAGEGKAGLLAGRPQGIHVKILRVSEGPLSLGERRWKGLELARGGIGEIAVSGEHVQAGYLGDPEGERRNKIRDGARVWHRTGDAGYLDRRGRLFLMGRVAQRVERVGRTWWSGEAERRAAAVDGVGFAAYFGEPDPRLGQKAVLCLEPRPGPALDRARLGSEVRAAVAPWPVDACHLVSRVPRDPRHGSKADLEGLRRLIARGRSVALALLLAVLAAGAAGAAAMFGAAATAGAGPAPLRPPFAVDLRASDGVALHAACWCSVPPAPRLVLVLPGYAQHSGTGTMRYIAALLTPTADVLVLDFRGTGGSDGQFTFGAKEPLDAQAALAWALPRYADVSLLGFSLGSYTALRACVEGPLRPARGLLVSLPQRVESIIGSGGVLSFLSVGLWQQAHDPLAVPEDADQMFRWGPVLLPKPKGTDLAARAALPLHLLAGGKDLLVFPVQSRRIFDALPGASTWTYWPDGRHAEHMALKHPAAFAAWARGCMAWTSTVKESDPFGSGAP